MVDVSSSYGGLKPIHNWGHPVTGIIDVGKKCLGSELRWDESLQGWHEQLWTASAANWVVLDSFQMLAASFSYVWVEGTLTYGFVYFFLQHQNCDGLSEDSLSKICRQLGHPIHMLATFTTSSIAPITIFISHLFLVRFRAEFAEDPGSNMFYSALK